MKIDVYDLNFNKVREIEVSDNIFAAEVKEHILHDVVKAQLRLRRSGTAKTRNRSEVSASSRKIYKQKGTGNARHGAKDSPLFPKGGVVWGPRGVISAYKVNKKVMRGGLISALSLKVKEQRFFVVDSWSLKSFKTKEFKSVLTRFQIEKGLIVDDCETTENLYLASRNLKDMKLIKTGGVNVFDILKYKTLLLSEESVRKIEQRLSK
ncbi:50S ribosomal protein L4 [bacterium]|nr:50S ribosomal protein L4 [bacterium]